MERQKHIRQPGGKFSFLDILAAIVETVNVVFEFLLETLPWPINWIALALWWIVTLPIKLLALIFL